MAWIPFYACGFILFCVLFFPTVKIGIKIKTVIWWFEMVEEVKCPWMPFFSIQDLFHFCVSFSIVCTYMLKIDMRIRAMI